MGIEAINTGGMGTDGFDPGRVAAAGQGSSGPAAQARAEAGAPGSGGVVPGGSGAGGAVPDRWGAVGLGAEAPGSGAAVGPGAEAPGSGSAAGPGEDAPDSGAAADPERLGALSGLAVVPLGAVGALDPAVVGAKAANLARAAVEGLPVLPGFVIVPAARVPGSAAGIDALHTAWREVGGPAGRPVVVRSSSAVEDTAGSSMAGRFESVLGVRSWEAFVAAVGRVLDSVGRVEGAAGSGMAVLVQPMVAAVAGGVMFGADPVAGRYDRIVVSAVAGGPDRLVDGSTQGVRYELTRRGRLVETDPAPARGFRWPRHTRRGRPVERDPLPGGGPVGGGGPGRWVAFTRRAGAADEGAPDAGGPLGRRRLARLVRLARRTERVYGGPQDVEFGFDGDGRLWLFQARPITAMAARPARGARLLGPGPVAETLPGVLQPLEEDLWVAPMAHGLTLALDIAGAAPRRGLRRLPVVTTVDGRAAADLRLLGAVHPAHSVLNFLNPVPGARRAGAAWRVGRLRTALPPLARDLIADVDRQLHDFGAPHELLSGELLDAVAWGRIVLATLHAQESLAGALLDADTGSTAAGEALAVLAEGRAQGLGDDELITRHPVLLTLLPPTLGDRAPLPERVGWNGVPRGVGFLSVREGLRLRIRWVQEMQAAMVREVGSRMDAHCLVGERRKIALLSWRELLTVGAGGGRPHDLAERTPRPQTPPLPAAFKIAGGRPQAVRPNRRGAGEGQGAGGGHGTGTAWDGDGARPRDAVLVVRSLDPALAPLLPGLAGLVAETGSVLSHLAVLAREYGVPTVVGVPGAHGRFTPGTVLAVDGGSGAVTPIDGAEPVPGARTGDGARPEQQPDPANSAAPPPPRDPAPRTGPDAPRKNRSHRKGAAA